MDANLGHQAYREPSITGIFGQFLRGEIAVPLKVKTFRKKSSIIRKS